MSPPPLTEDTFSATGLAEGAANDADASQGNVGAHKPPRSSPQLGSVRQAGSTDDGLAELAAMPIVEVHPLACYLRDRGVSLVDGARMLGVSRWTLADWIAGRSRPTWWRAEEIALALGVEVVELFPPADDP